MSQRNVPPLPSASPAITESPASDHDDDSESAPTSIHEQSAVAAAMAAAAAAAAPPVQASSPSAPPQPAASPSPLLSSSSSSSSSPSASPLPSPSASPPAAARRGPAISIPTPTAAFTTAELQQKAADSMKMKSTPPPPLPSHATAPRTAPHSHPPFPPPQRPISQAPPLPSGMGSVPPMPRAAPAHLATAPMGSISSQTPPPPNAMIAPAGYTPHAPQAMMMPGMTPPPGAAQSGAWPQPNSAVHSVALRADVPRDVRPAASHVVRSRAYAFVLDARGLPIEIGSGRFAKAYLGEERWLESKTDFRRYVVIKILQRGVVDEDRVRFQIEKELLERVQGHPNIITLYASGESDDPEFIPATIRDKVENDFVILERLDMSLEERLKGSRARGKRDDLLACDMRDRLFRVLDYMIPVASAVEYAHLVRNICHRDIKPANILVGLPDSNLRGSTLEVRLADFNVAKLHDEEVSFQVTQMKSVPGTLFFQSPEQETNVLELLVNVQQGSPEVEFFEDFYIQISKNDTFALFNRGEQYAILYSDRDKKRLVLDRPYRDTTETNVRAKVQKSVGRPADIYSLGALFYYLISGAYANPKTLYDAFHKFIEYEHTEENNTIESYLMHEYSVIDSMRAPKTMEAGVNVAPADRFFTYKHYLDGNGELVDPQVMKIIAKCMIRNKSDSYCQAHEIETRGISDLVQDLIDLYALYGFQPSAGSTQLARRGHAARGRSPFLRSLRTVGARIRWMWSSFLAMLGRKR